MSPAGGPTPADRLEASLRSPRRPGPALVAAIVGGYPSRRGFARALAEVSEVCDAVAIVVPGPAPLADGGAFARAVDDALADRVDLDWVLDELAARRARCPTVVVVPEADDALAARIASAGIDGILVGDLTTDAGPPSPAAAPGLAVARWVAPELDADEVARRCAEARGLVWVAGSRAVLSGALDLDAAKAWLDSVRPAPEAPPAAAVRCAAVGVRRPDQARRLAPHAEGIVLGTALVGLVAQGLDPRPLLDEIRAAVAPP